MKIVKIQFSSCNSNDHFVVHFSQFCTEQSSQLSQMQPKPQTASKRRPAKNARKPVNKRNIPKKGVKKISIASAEKRQKISDETEGTQEKVIKKAKLPPKVPAVKKGAKISKSKT